jgi:hypothetical protein
VLILKLRATLLTCAGGCTRFLSRCTQLREKLSEVQEENSLLGGLVKELKVGAGGQVHARAIRSTQHCAGSTRACEPATRGCMWLHPDARGTRLRMHGHSAHTQGERDGLQRRLSTASKHHSEASGKAAAAAAQADALAKEQQRLKADVSRLTSVVHSHSQRLTQWVPGRRCPARNLMPQGPRPAQARCCSS